MSSQTILVIDFDATDVDRTRNSLAEAGYRVEVARDGVAGIEAFEKLKPDLVVVEAILPKKHGFDVCQEIKSTVYGKCTPIVVTSTESKETKYLADALRIYGCDEYIQKPVSCEDLLKSCRRLLPDSGSPSPDVRPAATHDAAKAAQLDDLTEDELVERLDGLIEQVTADDDDESNAVEDGSGRTVAGVKPIRDADLVSFCERVFTPATSRLDESGKGGANEADPAAASPRSASGAVRKSPPPPPLTEEEVMGQLDALIPDERATKLRSLVRDAMKAPDVTEQADDERKTDRPDEELASTPVESAPAPAAPASEASRSKPASRSTEPPLDTDRPGSTLAPVELASRDAPAEPTRARVDSGASKAPTAPGSEPASAGSKSVRVPVEPRSDTARPGPARATARDMPSPKTVQPTSTPTPTASAADAVAPERTSPRSSRLVWGTGLAAAVLVAAGLVVLALLRGGSAAETAPFEAARMAVPAPPEPTRAPLIDDDRTSSHLEGTPLRSIVDAPPTSSPSIAAVVPAPPTRAERRTAPAGAVPESAGPAAPITARVETPPREAASPEAFESARVGESDGPDPAPAAVTEELADSRPDESVAAAIDMNVFLDRFSTTAPFGEGRTGSQPETDGHPFEVSDSATARPAEPSPPAPIPSVRRGDLVPFEQVDREPVPIEREPPEYDPFSRRMRQEGTVVLRVLIDEEGRVTDVEQVEGIPSSRLNAAAARAAEGWRYRPAIKNGVPVKVWMIVSLDFRI